MTRAELDRMLGALAEDVDRELDRLALVLRVPRLRVLVWLPELGAGVFDFRGPLDARGSSPWLS